MTDILLIIIAILLFLIWAQGNAIGRVIEHTVWRILRKLQGK